MIPMHTFYRSEKKTTEKPTKINEQIENKKGTARVHLKNFIYA